MEATQGHPQKPQMRPKECWSEAHKETGQGVLDTGPDSMGDLETGRYNLKRQRQAAQEVSGPLVLLPLIGRFSDNV